MDTTINLSPLAKTYYDRRFLEKLKAKYIHGKWADEALSVKLEKGQGYKWEWTMMDSLPAVDTPLTEGVTPEAQTTNASTMQAQPQEYGAFIAHSNVVEFVSICPLITKYVDLCADQAAKSVDNLDKNRMNAGTNVIFGGSQVGRSSVTSSDYLKLNSELLAAINLLERNEVPKIDDEFGGSYVILIHSDTALRIRKDADWSNADDYSSETKKYTGEIGRWHGGRFVVSSLAKVFSGAGASGINVYSTLVFGGGWYGSVRWNMDPGPDAKKIEAASCPAAIIIKPKGSSGAADPLNQRGTVGWILNHELKIIDQLRGVRIEHAA